MAIQTTEGPIRIDPDDLQFTYRGKTIALKVRVSVWPVLLGCVQQSDGTWVAEADLTGDLFSSDVPGGGDPVAYHLAQKGGDPVRFIREVVLPKLNEWLRLLFRANGAPVPPLEQITVALAGVRFVPQPDGTLKLVQ